MDRLARREHSEWELQRKLRSKGYNDCDIQPVMDTLVRDGLVSNARFVETYIHYRTEKGYGPLRILAELLARGLPEDMIEHHLDIADNAWLLRAHAAWQKRFRGLIPRDFKTRAKQMRFLQSRGFTLDQIDNIFHSDTHYA